jgi:hypothetical protein
MIAQGIAIWYFVVTLWVAPIGGVTQGATVIVGKFLTQVACEQFRQDLSLHVQESTAGIGIGSCQMRLQP